MKRIIIITLITCLLIPFFAINTFASSYDLGIPTLWTSPWPNNSTNPYPTFISDKMLNFMLLYYDSYPSSGGFHDNYNWAVTYGNVSNLADFYSSLDYKSRDPNLDYNSPAIAFGVGGFSSLNNTIVIPGIKYSNLYWPADNQVIKIQFSVDTFALGTSSGFPDSIDYLSPERLCFFTVTTGNQSDDTHNIQIAPHFDSVVISSEDSREVTFTYYFNAYGNAFDDLRNYVFQNHPGSMLELVVRIPFYYGSNSKLSNGAYTVSNANLPVSYELITPGDYSQDLNAIENAIITSNDKLMDYYDTLSGEDQAVIVHAKQQNDKLDNTIKDYDNAQDGIDDIVNNVTLPPVNIDDANASFEDLGLGNLSTNQNIWQGPIIAMAVISFSFAILSLILYGKKE